MDLSDVQRGEIWLVQFDERPEKGEQGFRRPAVVVSSNPLNTMPLNVVIVVPSTTHRRVTRSGKVPDNLVEVVPSEFNGLNDVSYFMSEQVRAVSKSARLKRRLGMMSDEDVIKIDEALCLVLNLFP